LNQKLDVKTGNFDFQSDHSQDFATKLYRLVNYGKLLKITPSVKIKNYLNIKKIHGPVSQTRKVWKDVENYISSNI